MTQAGRFAGKVALVTGAGSGIGAATVRAFAAEGAAVVVMDLDGDAAEETAKRLGPAAVPVTGDVRSDRDCARAVRAARDDFGGLDVVFCNAGVFVGGTAESQTEQDWDLQVDTLLKGTFLTVKHAVPALRARGGGSIVLSGSNCSHIGCAGRFAYTAAKAAMPVLAKQLSNDYFHSANIRANCVSPGYVQSGMTEETWRLQTGAEPGTAVPDKVTEKWQRPESIASTVLFLAGDDAADITGVTVPVSRTALLRTVMMRMG